MLAIVSFKVAYSSHLERLSRTDHVDKLTVALEEPLGETTQTVRTRQASIISALAITFRAVRRRGA